MFTFKLELEGGTPADPPTFTVTVPNWNAGEITTQLEDETLLPGARTSDPRA